ncbi:MAG: hypothetical protein A2901_02235 [Elusimicrobia bacterium RIFCSPLOWO2_01_FULL_54_10]|nr:MAG: hypothetical protein A2901_02235 [Elusimicrobia bacterium RIFCSPLOWO2_01_FULL_54_10]
MSTLTALLKMEPPPLDFPGASPKNLERLLMISQGMTHYRDLDQVLGYLLSAIRESYGVDCGVLMLEDEQVYRIRSHRGFSPSFVTRFTVPLGQGVLGRSATTGQGLVIARSQFSQAPDSEHLFKASGWGSVLVAPIMLQSHNLGLFLAASPDENFFSPEVSESLRPYLQVLSVGMRNIEMMDTMEKFNRRLTSEVTSTTQELTQTNARLIRRVRELKALYEITLSASMQANLEDLLDSVAPKIADFFNVEHVGFLINTAPKGRRPELSLGFPSFGLPRGDNETFGFPTDAEGGPLLSSIISAFTNAEIRYFSGGPASLGRELANLSGQPVLGGKLDKIIIRSMVAAPLKTAQGAHGVLLLSNPIRDAGTGPEASDKLRDEDLRTLTLVAIRIATAIENADLEGQNRKRLTDLSALQEINESFYATPILEFILAKIVRVVNKTFKCELCDFLLLEPASAELMSFPASVSGASPSSDPNFLRDPKNVSSQVFADKKSRIVENVHEDFSLSRLGLEHKIRSLLLVPLKVEQEVIGVLRLGSSEEGVFGEDHVRLAELIADRSAVIVHNARLYEKIIAANRELERLNSVKTEFVSMVSHELRTPVTAIKGFVDVVLSEDAGPINEQQKRFLNIAHNSIERLSLLILDLLDISRIESGQMKIILQPVSIEKVIQDAHVTYRSGIETKNISFELHMDKKIPMVVADESRVKQVIDNLISNATKFTPAGGTIKMSADDLGDFVLVSVADSGVGIKKDDQEKIFSMFYQVDSSLTRKVGGTGLGLAISKSIIEMHGGRIWVESEPGRGSTFRFLLPRHREQQAEVV